MLGDASSSESDTVVLASRTGVLGLCSVRSPPLLLSIGVVRCELDCKLGNSLVTFNARDLAICLDTEVWRVIVTAED
jgi:hypothetical protein